ncbi:MAG: HpcH/HpaI aldolase/citrate lyase family protein [Janthinobacterium lividum]
MKPPRLTRTYLAVPAHRRRLVESAARSSADAVFLDLEDAVSELEKVRALGEACSALQQLDWGQKTVAVRVNAFGSAFLQTEIEALACQARLDAIIVPKAERCSDIVAISSWLAGAEVLPRAPIEIELLIETALGLLQVDSLAQADQRVTALHLGVGDLAASLGARSAEIGGSPERYQNTVPVHGGYLRAPLDLFAYPMMRLLVAARAFGLRAIDGPCGAYQNLTLTKEWAGKAAAMGFDGKQVIHPTQLDLTRAAFIPDAEECLFAQRVIDAMEIAERDGKGAVSVDGKMIDLANVRMARRILQLASQHLQPGLA